MAIEPNSDDWDLLSRAYESDDWAATQLATKYRKRLVRYANVFLYNEEDAEDVFQETMMKLFKTRRAPKTPQSNVAAWLYTVCRNKCLDLLRERERKRKLEPSVLESERDLLRERKRKAESTHTTDIEKIKAVLNRLNPSERLVIELRYLAAEDPMPNKDIAQVLSISESAATKLHNSAIGKLRLYLELPPDDTSSGEPRT